jgi:hypothetical protein
MKIFLTSRERMAGLFMVITVALVAAFFVGAAVRNRWLAPRVTFHTLISRGDGLRSGSPVLLSGVEVGEVGRIEFRDDDQLDVQLVILAEHSARVRKGTTVNVRRLLGIGEKRLLLQAPRGVTAVVATGSMLPAIEPMDVLDVVSDLDFGTLVKTTGRALGVVERLLGTLEENNRLDHIVATVDRLGPTLDRLDKLIDAVQGPVVALLTDPALHGALAGADALLNDPVTPRAVRNVAQGLEPKRVDRLVGRADLLLERLDSMTGDKGRLPSLLEHADKMLSDDRIGRLVGAMERLTDEKKLARLLDNLSVLAEQTGKVAPELPHLTKELTLTLREAVIVLKALQKTWVLEGKVDDARKELKKDEKKDDAPPK